MSGKEKKYADEPLSDDDWEIELNEHSNHQWHHSIGKRLYEIFGNGWKTGNRRKKGKLDIIDSFSILFFLLIIGVFTFAFFSQIFREPSDDDLPEEIRHKNNWVLAGPSATRIWLASDNVLQDSYDISSRVRLHIRKCEEGTDIFLTSANYIPIAGNSILIEYDKKNIPLRALFKHNFWVQADYKTTFKDGTPVNSYYFFSEENTEAIFLNFETGTEPVTEDDFISKLKNANTLTMEIETQYAGKQKIKFSLKWLNL